jgi:hypothetical protein
VLLSLAIGERGDGIVRLLNIEHSRRRLMVEIEMRTGGSARDSATASLVDPHPDLLVLAMCETESTLRSFLPVFG